MSSFLFSISMLGFLVFLVLSIINLIKKNGKAKKTFIITGSCFVIMGVSSAFLPSSETITTSNQSDNKSIANEEDKTKSKEVSLKDEIKNAADPHFGKITDFEVNDDLGKNDGGKIVLIHVKQDSLTKRTADYNTVNALAKVFKINKVNEITYFWEATLTDTKGNESVDTVVKIQMNKKTASSIKWDNFLYTNLDKVADSYNLSPVLQ